MYARALVIISRSFLIRRDEFVTRIGRLCLDISSAVNEYGIDTRFGMSVNGKKCISSGLQTKEKVEIELSQQAATLKCRDRSAPLIYRSRRYTDTFVFNRYVCLYIIYCILFIIFCHFDLLLFRVVYGLLKLIEEIFQCTGCQHNICIGTTYPMKEILFHHF